MSSATQTSARNDWDNHFGLTLILMFVVAGALMGPVLLVYHASPKKIRLRNAVLLGLIWWPIVLALAAIFFDYIGLFPFDKYLPGLKLDKDSKLRKAFDVIGMIIGVGLIVGFVIFWLIALWYYVKQETWITQQMRESQRA